MRFSLFAGLALMATTIAHPFIPREDATTTTDPSTDLAEWTKQAIAEFQPTHLGWQLSYDKYFSPSLTATFNSTHYNFTTFKLFYTAIEALVGLEYSDFTINVTNIVAVPDPGSIGGRSYVLGIEGGHRRDNGVLVTATDGAFAVVGVEGGQRKFVEFRESNNFPSS